MEIKPLVCVADLVGVLSLTPKDCGLKVVGSIPLVGVDTRSNQSMFFTTMSLSLSQSPPSSLSLSKIKGSISLGEEINKS